MPTGFYGNRLRCKQHRLYPRLLALSARPSSYGVEQRHQLRFAHRGRGGEGEVDRGVGRDLRVPSAGAESAVPSPLLRVGERQAYVEVRLTDDPDAPAAHS
jgi:hypothetical protein